MKETAYENMRTCQRSGPDVRSNERRDKCYTIFDCISIPSSLTAARLESRDHLERSNLHEALSHEADLSGMADTERSNCTSPIRNIKVDPLRRHDMSFNITNPRTISRTAGGEIKKDFRCDKTYDAPGVPAVRVTRRKCPYDSSFINDASLLWVAAVIIALVFAEIPQSACQSHLPRFHSNNQNVLLRREQQQRLCACSPREFLFQLNLTASCPPLPPPFPPNDVFGEGVKDYTCSVGEEPIPSSTRDSSTKVGTSGGSVAGSDNSERTLLGTDDKNEDGHSSGLTRDLRLTSNVSSESSDLSGFPNHADDPADGTVTGDVVDFKPVIIDSIQFIEVDPQFNVINQDPKYVRGINFTDGDLFNYTSISSVAGKNESMYPGGMQMIIRGKNSAGERIRNLFTITYTNDCDVETFGVGEQIGWVVFRELVPAVEETCDAVAPTTSPTQAPTLSSVPTPSSPTMKPTNSPTGNPTGNPSFNPSLNPTKNPTQSPTKTPTINPTSMPSGNPTTEPIVSPSLPPTKRPTTQPTFSPTLSPTTSLTNSPTASPSSSTIQDPTLLPTSSPTRSPENAPTTPPTNNPTATLLPSANPTTSPKIPPTRSPTMEGEPTHSPIADMATESPTENPTPQFSSYSFGLVMASVKGKSKKLSNKASSESRKSSKNGKSGKGSDGHAYVSSNSRDDYSPVYGSGDISSGSKSGKQAKLGKSKKSKSMKPIFYMNAKSAKRNRAEPIRRQQFLPSEEDRRSEDKMIVRNSYSNHRDRMLVHINGKARAESAAEQVLEGMDLDEDMKSINARGYRYTAENSKFNTSANTIFDPSLRATVQTRINPDFEYLSTRKQLNDSSEKKRRLRHRR